MSDRTTSGRLTGRRAVVTGAAKGMGAEIVQRFLAEGAQVVAADLDAGALADLKSHPAVSTVAASIASEPGAQAIAAAAEAIGGAQILVNNAGIFPTSPFEDMSFEQWKAVIDVNLHGTFLVTKALFPQMKAAGWGRVINIGSSSFLTGAPNATHYIASKGGVLGFARGLAGEIGKYGITVNTVTPGLTTTGTALAQTPPEVLEAKRRGRAVPRDQAPGDIVGAVLFLATPDADFISGQIINVDGGGARY